MLAYQGTSSLARRGGVLQGCLVVVAILLIIAIAGGIVVAMNWRGWTADVMSAAAKEIINDSDLPAGEKPEIIAICDELAEGFRNEQVTFEELGSIFEGFEDAPVLWMGLTIQFDAAYVQRSSLPTEEKEAGSLALNRFVQGLESGVLTAEDAKATLDPVLVDDGSGSKELVLPGDATPEQIRTVIELARARADDAGVPAEAAEVDLSEAFRGYIEERLGRPLGEAPPAG